MAEEITIRGTTEIAKIRSPLAPLGLGLLTLGIYGIFWWYFINNEMNALGKTYDDDYMQNSPGMAALAISVGGLIIVPPFVSLWRTCKRIERSQERVLGSNNFSPLLCFILAFIPLAGIAVPIMMQSNLNQVWERQQ
jgi:hypothetical protein